MNTYGINFFKFIKLWIFYPRFRRLLKYNNPDKRCRYPFSPNLCGYCWSYAHFVDAGMSYLKFESSKYNKIDVTCMLNMTDICSGRIDGSGNPCEFWKETK